MSAWSLSSDCRQNELAQKLSFGKLPNCGALNLDGTSLWLAFCETLRFFRYFSHFFPLKLRESSNPVQSRRFFCVDVTIPTRSFVWNWTAPQWWNDLILMYRHRCLRIPPKCWMDHFWRPNIASLLVHNIRSVRLKHRQSLFWGQSCLEKARQILSRLDQKLQKKMVVTQSADKTFKDNNYLLLVFMILYSCFVVLLISIRSYLDFSCAGGNCSLTCCASGHDTANELRLAPLDRIGFWRNDPDPGTWRNVNLTGTE